MIDNKHSTYKQKQQDVNIMLFAWKMANSFHIKQKP